MNWELKRDNHMKDTGSISKKLTIEEAKEIMKSGLGKAELEFVTSLTAPLYSMALT
jgi:hypothetical protein